MLTMFRNLTTYLLGAGAEEGVNDVVVVDANGEPILAAAPLADAIAIPANANENPNDGADAPVAAAASQAVALSSSASSSSTMEMSQFDQNESVEEDWIFVQNRPKEQQQQLAEAVVIPAPAPAALPQDFVVIDDSCAPLRAGEVSTSELLEDDERELIGGESDDSGEKENEVDEEYVKLIEWENRLIEHPSMSVYGKTFGSPSDELPWVFEVIEGDFGKGSSSSIMEEDIAAATLCANIFRPAARPRARAALAAAAAAANNASAAAAGSGGAVSPPSPTALAGAGNSRHARRPKPHFQRTTTRPQVLDPYSSAANNNNKMFAAQGANNPNNQRHLLALAGGHPNSCTRRDSAHFQNSASSNNNRKNKYKNNQKVAHVNNDRKCGCKKFC